MSTLTFKESCHPEVPKVPQGVATTAATCMSWPIAREIAELLLQASAMLPASCRSCRSKQFIR